MRMNPPRTFIRVEYLSIGCVTVVLRQSNGIWACCCFDKKNNNHEFFDFNDFNAAMKFADDWIRTKKVENKEKKKGK